MHSERASVNYDLPLIKRMSCEALTMWIKSMFSQRSAWKNAIFPFLPQTSKNKETENRDVWLALSFYSHRSCFVFQIFIKEKGTQNKQVAIDEDFITCRISLSLKKNQYFLPEKFLFNKVDFFLAKELDRGEEKSIRKAGMWKHCKKIIA